MQTMQVTKLDDTIAIGGQITTADVQRLADQGYKSIICNRPDNENHVQTGFADIEQAAIAAGLAARYVPVSHRGMSMADIEDFGKAREELAGPHFAYCHSGGRTSGLWALHQATSGVEVHEILQKANDAGYRLDHMAGMLRQMAANAA